MGLILWIDQNTLATNLIEKVFKQKNLPFYGITSVEDFQYLVEDLRPVLIVLDTHTYLTHPEAFKRQYEASELLRNTPMVLLDNDGRLNFLQNKIGELNRPLEPFRLPEQLMEILQRA
jgi:hypothetical protein